MGTCVQQTTNTSDKQHDVETFNNLEKPWDDGALGGKQIQKIMQRRMLFMTF